MDNALVLIYFCTVYLSPPLSPYPGLAFFHDFVVTDNYYVYSSAPLDFDPLPFVLGQKVFY